MTPDRANTPHRPFDRGHRTTSGIIAALAAATVFVGCSGSANGTAATHGTGGTGGTGDTSQAVSSTASSTDETSPALELRRLKVDVQDPLDTTVAKGSLLVAQRAGTIRELVPDGKGDYVVAGTLVDLTNQVGDTSAEKGLLGIAADPSGSRLFVNHTRAGDGATVISEFELSGDTGAMTATEEKELLVIEQPFPNHNGGDLTWGPDGMLWTGTGDGGSGGDPEGRAQRLDTPLGKILRIDPDAPDLVPADNPYADKPVDSDEAHTGLIWARGVRNPWRITFDADTGDLWVADVGENRWEEVDVLRKHDGLGRGADLGWDRREGLERFADPGPTDGWPDDDAPEIEPVHVYDHSQRCSISGGYVVRSESVAGLDGWYLFSDYCDGRIRALTPGMAAVDLGLAGHGVVSISPDERGEPLVLDSKGLSRIELA